MPPFTKSCLYYVCTSSHSTAKLPHFSAGLFTLGAALERLDAGKRITYVLCVSVCVCVVPAALTLFKPLGRFSSSSLALPALRPLRTGKRAGSAWLPSAKTPHRSHEYVKRSGDWLFHSKTRWHGQTFCHVKSTISR